jgi:integrase
MILRRHIQPLAKKFGIPKKIGWHTFRRNFASILKASGEDVKVVQELCRHATPGITMALYAQAFSDDVRRAQNNLVETVRQAPLLPAQNAVGA